MFIDDIDYPSFSWEAAVRLRLRLTRSFMVTIHKDGTPAKQLRYIKRDDGRWNGPADTTPMGDGQVETAVEALFAQTGATVTLQVGP